MKTCNVCGKELDMSAEFCDACGSSDLKSPEVAKVEAPAPKKGGKALAIVGLILPIVGIVIYFASLIIRTLFGFLITQYISGILSIPVTVIAVILCIVGLVLAIVALVKKTKMGIASIIVSALSLLGITAVELFSAIILILTTIFGVAISGLMNM